MAHVPRAESGLGRADADTTGNAPPIGCHTRGMRGPRPEDLLPCAKSPFRYNAADICRSVSITARAGPVKRPGPLDGCSRRRRNEPRRRISRGGVDAFDGLRLLQAVVQRDEWRDVVANTAAEALDLQHILIDTAEMAFVRLIA